MNIFSKHCSEEELDSVFDLSIYCSGYEPRSVFLFSKEILSKKNIVLGFASFNDHKTRKKNDKFFVKKGCEIIDSDGNNPNIIHQLLNNFLDGFEGKVFKLFVDYSSMTRVWYAEVLAYFRDIEDLSFTVEVVFGYSFAKFQPPPEENYRNLFVSPIDGFSYFSVPNKPTALIIGLGYEKNKAFGLSEYFDGETFVFYNKDSNDERFKNSLEIINESLLEDIPEENKYIFPIYDLEFTERQLFSLCGYLKDDYRVIVAPTGPKPFTLVSLIISLKMNEIDVWRISQGDNRKAIQFEADGKISLYKVVFDYNDHDRG